MFVCYGCGWTDSKPQNSTSGNLIATHLLELMMLVDIPPNLVINDSAVTEIKGNIKRLISCCNILFDKLNKDKIKNNNK